jgi:predicted HTH transcriptional regulator/TusA-related sulfurtransferase
MKNKYVFADLIALINDKNPVQNVEFHLKLNDPDELAKTIVAFANTSGGTLVLGIGKHTLHLVGYPHSKETIEEVCKRKISPSLNVAVSKIERGDKAIYVLDIPEGADKPYRVNNISYTRENNKIEVATAEEEKEMNPWGVNGLNTRQRQALAFLNTHPRITNKEYRELCDVSHKTAHIELTELLDKEVLVVEGAGRSTYYRLATPSDKANIRKAKAETKTKSAPALSTPEIDEHEELEIKSETQASDDDVPSFLKYSKIDLEVEESDNRAKVEKAPQTENLFTTYKEVDLEPFSLDYANEEKE